MANIFANKYTLPTGLEVARGRELAKQNAGLPIFGNGVAGNFVGGLGSAFLGGLGDTAQFIGANNVGDFLNAGAESIEEHLKPAKNAEFSWDYVLSPEGLARGLGNLGGSIASIALPTIPLGGVISAGAKLFRAPTLGARLFRGSKLPSIGMGTAKGMVRGAITGPMEAAMEAGNYERNALLNGVDPKTARENAWGVFDKNIGVLTASNALQFGLFNKVLNGTGWKSRLASAGANAGIQGLEEGYQQAAQLAAEGKPYTYNPFEWNNPQYASQGQAMLEGLLPMIPFGGAGFAIGSARRALKGNQAPQPEPNKNTNQAGMTFETLSKYANPWVGKQMDNGNVGCVEAVTKIGSYSPFLREERKRGVTGVAQLRDDAKAKGLLVPYDENNLQAGDVLGWKDDSHSHVVIYDGKGGYFGNNSEQNQIVHREKPHSYGKPDWVIKTGVAENNKQTSQKQNRQRQGEFTVEQFMKAIGDQESGGDYNSVNPDSGARGKYQFMPSSWGDYVRMAGLPSNTPQTPENEEIVARSNMQRMYNKFGNWRDVAIAWYGGEGAVNYSEAKKNAPQYNNGKRYPSINEYADKAMERLNKLAGTSTTSKAKQQGSILGVKDYNMPTQSDRITQQVGQLKNGWQQIIPQIGGALKDKFGINATISSAARTAEHNAAVGGVPTSHHIIRENGGDALDMVFDRDTTAAERQKILDYFKGTGLFKEVIYHNAGSGYHLHIGGLNADKVSNAQTTKQGKGKKISGADDPNFTARQNAVWREAQWVAAEAKKRYGYNLNPGWIFAQWRQETGENFDAGTGRMDNIGGLKDTSGKMIDFTKRGGLHGYAEHFLTGFLKQRPELEAAKTAEDYWEIMWKTGYFGNYPDTQNDNPYGYRDTIVKYQNWHPNSEGYEESDDEEETDSDTSAETPSEERDDSLDKMISDLINKEDKPLFNLEEDNEVSKNVFQNFVEEKLENGTSEDISKYGELLQSFYKNGELQNTKKNRQKLAEAVGGDTLQNIGQEKLNGKIDEYRKFMSTQINPLQKEVEELEAKHKKARETFDAYRANKADFDTDVSKAYQQQIIDSKKALEEKLAQLETATAHSRPHRIDNLQKEISELERRKEARQKDLEAVTKERADIEETKTRQADWQPSEGTLSKLNRLESLTQRQIDSLQRALDSRTAELEKAKTYTARQYRIDNLEKEISALESQKAQEEKNRARVNRTEDDLQYLEPTDKNSKQLESIQRKIDSRTAKLETLRAETPPQIDTAPRYTLKPNAQVRNTDAGMQELLSENPKPKFNAESNIPILQNIVRKYNQEKPSMDLESYGQRELDRQVADFNQRYAKSETPPQIDRTASETKAVEKFTATLNEGAKPKKSDKHLLKLLEQGDEIKFNPLAKNSVSAGIVEEFAKDKRENGTQEEKKFFKPMFEEGKFQRKVANIERTAGRFGNELLEFGQNELSKKLEEIKSRYRIERPIERESVKVLPEEQEQNQAQEQPSQQKAFAQTQEKLSRLNSELENLKKQSKILQKKFDSAFEKYNTKEYEETGKQLDALDEEIKTKETEIAKFKKTPEYIEMLKSNLKTLNEWRRKILFGRKRAGKNKLSEEQLKKINEEIFALEEEITPHKETLEYKLSNDEDKIAEDKKIEEFFESEVTKATIEKIQEEKEEPLWEKQQQLKDLQEDYKVAQKTLDNAIEKRDRETVREAESKLDDLKQKMSDKQIEIDEYRKSPKHIEDLKKDLRDNEEWRDTIKKRIEKSGQTKKRSQILQDTEKKILALEKEISELENPAQEDKTFAIKKIGAKFVVEGGKNPKALKKVAEDLGGKYVAKDNNFAFSTLKDAQEFLKGKSDAENAPSGDYESAGIVGNDTEIETDSGKEISVRYKIVPATSLNTSHKLKGDDVSENKNYPAKLQPRDRQGEIEHNQVIKMRNNLDTRRLGENIRLNEGAPVVREDGVVLNGNGRAMAIESAYDEGKADNYKQFLTDNAEKFGFKSTDVEKIENPVLIREVTQKLDDATTNEIIKSKVGGIEFKITEQAKADAETLTLKDFNDYKPNEDGDISSAGNEKFCRNVLEKIVPSENERNKYFDKDGNLNGDAIRRIKNAIYALAYSDYNLISKNAESTSDNIKNISTAAQKAAVDFAKLKLKQEEGLAEDFNIGDVVADAVKLYDEIKQDKNFNSVKDYVNQQDLFGARQQAVSDIISTFDSYKNNSRRIAEYLKDIAKAADKKPNPNQEKLFDDGYIKVEIDDLVRNITSKYLQDIPSGNMNNLFDDSAENKNKAVAKNARENISESENKSAEKITQPLENLTEKSLNDKNYNGKEKTLTDKDSVNASSDDVKETKLSSPTKIEIKADKILKKLEIEEKSVLTYDVPVMIHISSSEGEFKDKFGDFRVSVGHFNDSKVRQVIDKIAVKTHSKIDSTAERWHLYGFKKLDDARIFATAVQKILKPFENEDVKISDHLLPQEVSETKTDLPVPSAQATNNGDGIPTTDKPVTKTISQSAKGDREKLLTDKEIEKQADKLFKNLKLKAHSAPADYISSISIDNVRGGFVGNKFFVNLGYNDYKKVWNAIDKIANKIDAKINSEEDRQHYYSFKNLNNARIFAKAVQSLLRGVDGKELKINEDLPTAEELKKRNKEFNEIRKAAKTGEQDTSKNVSVKENISEDNQKALSNVTAEANGGTTAETVMQSAKGNNEKFVDTLKHFLKVAGLKNQSVIEKFAENVQVSIYKVKDRPVFRVSLSGGLLDKIKIAYSADERKVQDRIKTFLEPFWIALNVSYLRANRVERTNAVQYDFENPDDAKEFAEAVNLCLNNGNKISYKEPEQNAETDNEEQTNKLFEEDESEKIIRKAKALLQAEKLDNPKIIEEFRKEVGGCSVETVPPQNPQDKYRRIHGEDYTVRIRGDLYSKKLKKILATMAVNVEGIDSLSGGSQKFYFYDAEAARVYAKALEILIDGKEYKKADDTTLAIARRVAFCVLGTDEKRNFDDVVNDIKNIVGEENYKKIADKVKQEYEGLNKILNTSDGFIFRLQYKMGYIKKEDYEEGDKQTKSDLREVFNPKTEEQSKVANTGEQDTSKAELAEGYKTESGRSLQDAGRDEFILKPDGSKDFGRIDENIIDKANEELEKLNNSFRLKNAPIRLQVGMEDRGESDGFGYKHILNHLNDIKNKGFENIPSYVEHILKNFNQIYKSGQEENRIILYCKGDQSKGLMPLDLELEKGADNFYTIISAYPRRRVKKEETLLVDVRPTNTPTDTASVPHLQDSNHKHRNRARRTKFRLKNCKRLSENIQGTIKIISRNQILNAANMKIRTQTKSRQDL